MMNRIILGASLALWAGAGFAAETIRIAPRAAWIIPASTPVAPKQADETAPIRRLLVDFQARFDGLFAATKGLFKGVIECIEAWGSWFRGGGWGNGQTIADRTALQRAEVLPDRSQFHLKTFGSRRQSHGFLMLGLQIPDGSRQIPQGLYHSLVQHLLIREQFSAAPPCSPGHHPTDPSLQPS